MTTTTRSIASRCTFNSLDPPRTAALDAALCVYYLVGETTTTPHRLNSFAEAHRGSLSLWRKGRTVHRVLVFPTSRIRFISIDPSFDFLFFYSVFLPPCILIVFQDFFTVLPSDVTNMGTWFYELHCLWACHLAIPRLQ
jgi:hypothetical protein